MPFNPFNPFNPLLNMRRAYIYKETEILQNDITTTPEALKELIVRYRAIGTISATESEAQQARSTFRKALTPAQLVLIESFQQIIKDIERNFTLSLPNISANEITVFCGNPPVVPTLLELSDPEKQVILLEPELNSELQNISLRLNLLRTKEKAPGGLSAQENKDLADLSARLDFIVDIKNQRAEAALAYYLFESGTVYASQLLKIGSMQGLLAKPLELLQSDLKINNQNMHVFACDYNACAFLFTESEDINDLQVHSTQVVFHLCGAEDGLYYYKDKKTHQIMSADDTLAEIINEALRSKQVTRNPLELRINYNGESLILEPLVSIQQVVSTGVLDDANSNFETKFTIHHPDIIMEGQGAPELILPPLNRRIGFFIQDIIAIISEAMLALATAIYNTFNAFFKKEVVLRAMEQPLEADMSPAASESPAPVAPISGSDAALNAYPPILLSRPATDNNLGLISSVQSISSYKNYFEQRKDRAVKINDNKTLMTVSVPSSNSMKPHQYYIESNQDVHNLGTVFKVDITPGKQTEEALISIICEDAANAAIAAYEANAEVVTFDLSGAPDDAIKQQMHVVFSSKLDAYAAKGKPFEIKGLLGPGPASSRP